MKVKVSKLKPHPKNQDIYNLSSIDDLTESIIEYGLLEKIVIDKSYRVISGHRRLQAIKILEWKTVDCEVVNVSDDESVSLLIQHNKQRVKSVRELLNEAKVLMSRYKMGQGKRTDLTSVRPNKGSARDVVSHEIGVPSSVIGKLLFIEKEQPDYIDLIDKGIVTINQAYLQTQRITKEVVARKPKDIQLSDDDLFTFHNKSSVSMTEIKDGEVDLIFTSPPYWSKRKYTNSPGIGNEKEPSQYVEKIVNHFKDCKRVLNKRGSFFLNLGDTFYNGNLCNIPHRVSIGLQDDGWILRNTIIWSKTNPKPSSSKTNLTPSYEFIFHFVKDVVYKYSLTLAPLKHNDKPSLPPRHRGVGKSITSVYPYIPRDGKNMGDFWTEDIVKTAVVNQSKSDSSTEHPAPFPENIVTLPLLQTTDEGDLVLDPFMGSGTTGKVSNLHMRRFVGYDIQNY